MQSRKPQSSKWSNCVDECPVHAIYPQEDLPGEWKQYIQINADFFKNRK